MIHYCKRVLSTISTKDNTILSFSLLMLLLFVSTNISLMQNPSDTGGYYNSFDYGDHYMSVFNADDYTYSQYPPLARLVYLAYQKMIPDDILSIDNGEKNRNETFYPLAYSNEGNYILMLFYLLSIVPFSLLIYTSIKTKNVYKALFTFALCGSGLIIFTIQRGNIILFVFNCVLFFCVGHQSENKIIKELALLALAVAAGIKLYPVFFGVLLLKDKRWREAIRCVLYGVTSFVLPIFFIPHYLKDIGFFFENLVKYSNGYIGHGNWSIKSFVWLIFDGAEKSESFISLLAVVFTIIYLIISIYAFLITKKEWVIMLIPSMACFLLPGISYPYTLIFLFIPLISVLNVENKRITEFLVILIFFILSVYDRRVYVIKDWYSPFLIGALILIGLIEGIHSKRVVKDEKN